MKLFIFGFGGLLGLVCACAGFGATYGGGSGTALDPYQIWTAEQMNLIGLHQEDWDNCFKLMQDLDLSKCTNYNLIGTYISWSDKHPFTGIFDGGNHSISNFHYSVDRSYAGLFGYVNASSAEIKNLTLIAPDVNSGTSSYAGSLVGCAEAGSITNCQVVSGNVAGLNNIGGLVGFSSSAISNSSFQGNVLGVDGVGGLAGVLSTLYAYPYNQTIEVNRCFSTGTVIGVNGVGGFAGTISSGKYGMLRISYCYSESCASGTDCAGGFVGSGAGQIRYCYSTGVVTANTRAGGFAGSFHGYDEREIAFSCYWDTQTSGQAESSSGEGRTSTQMKNIETFVAWGCDGAWKINNGNDYPRLAWEGYPGQIITNTNYGGGSGTTEEPFLIYTPEQLNTIGLIPCHLNMHFKLMSDLDLSQYRGTEFNIIGTRTFPFTGVFDGNGKRIANFKYSTNVWNDGVGLFGDVEGSHSVIQDLTLIDPNIYSASGYNTGALAGTVRLGTIKNCHVQGGNVNGYDGVGGLIGVGTAEYSGDPGALIENCSANCNVSGHWDIGGLIGSQICQVKKCYSLSNVSGYAGVGGFVGFADYATTENCYSLGAVSAIGTVGGFVGSADYLPVFENCYTTSLVVSGIHKGGFAGASNNGIFKMCFWNSTLNPMVKGIGYQSANPATLFAKTTVELQTAETFVLANWDFIDETDNGTEDIWMIREGIEYPKFVWQNRMPSANAGSDKTAYANTSNVAQIELDGSGSSDADGDALSYKWTWVIGAETFEANSVNPTIELPVGVHHIQLMVNDGVGDSLADEVVITVVGAADAIGELKQDIAAMNLANGVANELTAKLDAAMKKLADGKGKNDEAAVNFLEAFVNAVNAQRGKKISEENAASLISRVQQIIEVWQTAVLD
jgi:hypothetical protein